MPRSRAIPVRLDEKTIEKIDELVREAKQYIAKDYTRSDFIREAIDYYMGELKRKINLIKALKHVGEKEVVVNA